MPEVAGVEHAWERAGEVTLHVAEAGEGPPLVLLHGWPQHWYEWRDLIAPLSRSRRVICPDLRGFGWSDAPPHGYALEQLARDVAALLDGMGVDEFDLAGHDWGGYVGYLLALTEPRRVRRFLALNIAPPFGGDRLATAAASWRLWYQLAIVAGPLGAATVAGHSPLVEPLRRWTGAARAWDEPLAEAFLSQFREPERVRASVALYRTFLARQLPAMAAGRWRRFRLRARTLALHGLEDRIVRPAHLRGFEPYADDMTVEMVAGIGHFIVDERPDLVLARARELFEV
jgi:pimeloyl-ACP methyl ester carboxylesterase